MFNLHFRAHCFVLCSLRNNKMVKEKFGVILSSTNTNNAHIIIQQVSEGTVRNYLFIFVIYAFNWINIKAYQLILNLTVTKESKSDRFLRSLTIACSNKQSSKKFAWLVYSELSHHASQHAKSCLTTLPCLAATPTTTSKFSTCG